jgi:HAD superfamily hydrolase (TIGR01549 family)
MIKSIIFDLDGVLLDSRKANVEFYQRLCEKAGYERPSEKRVLKAFNLTMMDAIESLTKEKSKTKIKKVWQLGRKTRYPTRLLVMPEYSKETIDILSHNYKLGIVTGRLRKGIYRFFRITKLGRYFDVIVAYEDYSKPKPNPESLLIALRKLNIKPKEAVYIGDALTDYQAAKNAGTDFIGFVGGSASKKDFKTLNVKFITSFKDLLREFQ